ncbi:MAG: amidohydrolase family protein [Planctomycetes bacterium]|nr:amidohydrolase family protein [Planctomycetota bacterium]
MNTWLDRGDLGPAWVVEHGLLRRGAREELLRSSLATRIDCAWAADVELRPGFVNAHTHLYSGLAPLGMPAPKRAPDTFLQILERVWWRLDRALDARALRASARLALAEGLLAGTTSFVDHHESPEFVDGSLDVLAECAEELGARLVVTYGATERNGGREEARRGLEECARFVRANASSPVRGLVGLHASFTVGDDTLREAGELARELGVPVHVHVAEDWTDVADAHERGYDGALGRLLACDALPKGSILAHGVHLTVDEVRRASELGLWLVQNPRSNEGNKVGYPRALVASANVALGTDGWPADMRVERDALFRLGTQNGDARAALDARVDAGRRLVGALTGAKLGAIEDGASADVILGAPNAPPRHVLVAGRVVVRNGELVTADLERLRSEARFEAARLWPRMSALPEPA